MPKTILMQERVASLISKPPHQRANHDIEEVMPWLRKKSELLNNLDRGEITSLHLIEFMSLCVTLSLHARLNVLLSY